MGFAIEQIYEEYKKDVYYYLYGLTRNQSVSEELTSEVFVSAITSLPNYKGASTIKTWLFSIARNKWYEHIRKEKKYKGIQERLESYIIDSDFNVENDYENKEIFEKIVSLLNMEDERSREIVNMRVEGYSFYEISQKMNISESSSRVIDFRVRKRIRESLIKEGIKDV